MIYRLTLILAFLFSLNNLSGQVFVKSDTLHKTRQHWVTGTGITVYTGGMLLLGNAWYKDNLSSNFQFFNDNQEWLQVDKIGHVFSSYSEARIVGNMYQWAGVPHKKSVILGMGAALLAQTSIEVFDGFASAWGFSWGDMTANVLGVASYGIQELTWKQQIFKYKISSNFQTYPTTPIASTSGMGSDHLQRRASELYGTNVATRLLKDYNAQTNWVSINIAAFQEESTYWPSWLNVAIGYSAENLYGGFGNSWTYAGQSYVLDKEKFPRYRQYLISLDIDLEKIPVKSPFLKTLFSFCNVFKIPAPALEWNTSNGMKWHWMYF